MAAERRNNHKDRSTRRAAPGAAPVIPVVEEQVRVGRRAEHTGTVRVTRRQSTTRRTVDEPVTIERAVVERVPVNRYLDAPAQARTEGDVLVIPVMEEVVVIQRRLLLREEVRVRRQRRTERRPQTIELRRQDVIVERTRPRGAAPARGPARARGPDRTDSHHPGDQT